MPGTPMTVVETPLFVRKAATLLDDDARSDLIVFVGMNPEAGSIVPEAGGVRKLRWVAPGRGKRGGLRVIYYFHNETFPLLTVYGKNQKANLTKAEKNQFKTLIPLLMRTYAKSKKL